METKSIKKIGLIAGGDHLPLILARAARSFGVEEIVAVSFSGQTSEEIEGLVDENIWVNVGQFGKLIKSLQSSGIRYAVMAGRINPALVLKDIRFDLKGLSTLKKIKDRRADSIFSVVVGELKAAGIELLDSTVFLKPLMPPPGLLTPRPLSREEKEDVEFGWRIAKGVAGLDIGQTVVVKHRAVVAVEAIEGTDETILRGGLLGGAGTVVVKVSKPEQDMRFDVPVIGPTSVETMHRGGAAVLAVEAGKTLFLDRESALEKARKFNIAIVALNSEGVF